jgi:hypothetical protein
MPGALQVKPMETYREPLRTLIGKYDAALCRRKHNKCSAQRGSKALWTYFSYFPRKSSPEQFSLCDTEDFIAARQAEGATFWVLRNELKHVRAFFSFLVNDLQMDLPIPVVVPRRTSASDAGATQSVPPKSAAEPA